MENKIEEMENKKKIRFFLWLASGGKLIGFWFFTRFYFAFTPDTDFLRSRGNEPNGLTYGTFIRSVGQDFRNYYIIVFQFLTEQWIAFEVEHSFYFIIV